MSDLPGTVCEWIYLAGLVIGTGIRKYFGRRYWKAGFGYNQSGPTEITLLVMAGLGFILPVAGQFSGWLDFADYEPPNWIGYAGAGTYAAAIWLLWRSHHDLGDNFSPFRQIRSEHRLVTGGVYARIRHPLYAAHWLWALAQILLIHNWISGPSLLLVFIPVYLYRVPREEKMMLAAFGGEYRDYMNRTNRLLPLRNLSSDLPKET